MRCSIARARVLSLSALVALLPIIAAGCNKLTPNGQTDDLTLLKSGSDKICVAPAVQALLHDDVLPHPSELSDGIPPAEAALVTQSISIGFSLTTLQSFDQAVSKASCSTTMHVANQDGQGEDFVIAYEISPAADASGGFVVTSRTEGAKGFATGLIEGVVARRAQQRQAQADQAQQAQVAAQQAQAEAQLRAVVTERWLKGVWVPADAVPGSCATSAAIRFQPGDVLAGGWGYGRWSLVGTELHLVGTRQGQPLDER